MPEQFFPETHLGAFYSRRQDGEIVYFESISIMIIITLSLTNGDVALSSPFQRRVIHHLLKTSVVLKKAEPLPN